MKLPIPSYPLIGYAAAGALLIGFGGGWYVEGLRWSASLLKAERGAVKQERRQQAQVDKQATEYETERTYEVQKQVVYQDRIRTVFKDKIVPGECAAPDDVVRVLAEAVTGANSRATGQSGGELPDAPAPAEPADRPRAVPVGRNDDRDLWGLRVETSAYDPSLAAQPLSLDLPDLAFGR